MIHQLCGILPGDRNGDGDPWHLLWHWWFWEAH